MLGKVINPVADKVSDEKLCALLSKTFNFERIHWNGHLFRLEKIKNVYKMLIRKTSRNISTCSIKVKLGSY